MDIQNMKNIVVLKNLPSNMIEEAFVVLKDNVKIHTQEALKNKKEEGSEIKKEDINKKNNKDYLLKEAEMIINDYVSNIEKKQVKESKEKVKLEEKCRKLKYLSLFLGLFSILSLMLIMLR